MSGAVEFSLSPECGARLANLCGAMDGNIAHVARVFDVAIRRRGGRFSLRGAAAGEAAETLRRLYARAEGGLDLTDVRMEIGGADFAPAESVSVPKASRRGELFAPRTAAQAELTDKIMRNSAVFCAGPAGTGKTHVALAAALQLLRDGVHERLVLARPAVEAGGERIGFLPGDMEQKVNPYLRPLHDILHRLLGRREAARRTACGRIEIIPLSFMRGLTIDDAVLVLDEAQNTLPSQMKMTLTRLGANGRMIATGDESQSDLPSAGGSGLSDAMRRLRGIPGVAMHRFSEKDIVRHPLVKHILRAYQETDGGARKPRKANGAKENDGAADGGSSAARDDVLTTTGAARKSAGAAARSRGRGRKGE
ncbi:MAG: PhoH family protein [Gammaproteobacteria bacterium]